MSTNAKSTIAAVVPALRYAGAPAAIEWLCAAFGFENPEGHLWTFGTYDPWDGAASGGAH